MQKRLIIILLFAIFIFSGATLFSIVKYVDPYQNTILAIVFLLLSFFLSFTSFCTILFYFFKKIYYRGEIYVYHIFTSLRQSFLIAIFIVYYMGLYVFEIPVLFPAILGGIILIFGELFFKNLER